MGGASEKIYARLPVWAQNLAITGYGFHWKRHRLGGRYREHVAAFREREAWSRDRWESHLAARFREQLQEAFRDVPLYRELWGAAGWDADRLARLEWTEIGRLPVLAKSVARAAGEKLISERARRAERLHVYHTSGSSGTPFRMQCTEDEHRHYIAAREVRSFGWAGTSLEHPRSMIGGRMVVPEARSGPPFHRYNAAERQVYFSAFHLSRETAPAYVEALNRHQPATLTGYAYSHYILARFMIEGGLRLKYRPRALILSSEKLTAPMRAAMEEAFGTRAYEEYGAVENCVLATECEKGRLHVQSDFGLVEILDAEGHPLPPGVPGRLVCTSLIARSQPLIRYEIGDVGAWATEPCPCGRDHFPVIQEIIGRLEDTVVGPDGREMVRFHGLFVGLEGVLEAQLIQEERARFCIRVVPGERFNAAEEQEILKRLHQRLGECKARVERVESIPRSANGKFRAVVSLVPRGR